MEPLDCFVSKVELSGAMCACKLSVRIFAKAAPNGYWLTSKDDFLAGVE